MEEDSSESMIIIDPSQEEVDEASARIPSSIPRFPPTLQSRQNRIIEIASIIGRLPAASRNRFLRRNEEEKSSDEGSQIHNQVGLHPEWYCMIPDNHVEFVRELIDQFGPVILYVYGKAIQCKLIDNYSSSTDVINKFLSKILASCFRFMSNAHEIAPMLEIISCMPKLKVLSEQVNLMSKGMMHSRVYVLSSFLCF
jgi:hypothetical protein